MDFKCCGVSGHKNCWISFKLSMIFSFINIFWYKHKIYMCFQSVIRTSPNFTRYWSHIFWCFFRANICFVQNLLWQRRHSFSTKWQCILLFNSNRHKTISLFSFFKLIEKYCKIWLFELIEKILLSIRFCLSNKNGFIVLGNSFARKTIWTIKADEHQFANEKCCRIESRSGENS